jgi:hypothetical protein
MPSARLPLLVLALLIVQPLAGCVGTGGENVSSRSAPTADGAADEIAFEQIHHPDEIRERVTELADRDPVDAQRIGTTLEGRGIDLVTVGEGPIELWIVGRQHGDEPTGGEAILLAIEALTAPDAELPSDAPEVVETFREHRDELRERVTFHFVPVGNPDGAAAYQRGTATGADPNRDHFAFAHPFSRALREAFWDRMPDACLDLHNMGTGATDFDAYGAEGPLLEAEPYERAVADANLAVREVDAAGGNGGVYNENYRSPEPADDQPNPTAFHPGTHDAFCTSRGAPGWTPEGAIEGGSNGAEDDLFAWATRLHQVTIAAHALHWAGLYDASEADVWKAEGVAEATTEHTFTLEDPGEVTLQTVWRQASTPGDHNAAPVRFTVTTPEGDTHEGRTPHPEAWTSTVHLEDGEPGEYELSITGASDARYEVRAYSVPDRAPLVEVDRHEDGLAVQAAGERSVQLQVSDVFAPAEVSPGDFAPTAEAVHELNGTVGERTVAEFSLTLAPGETVSLAEPDRLEDRGPYHVTASAGDRVQTVVEDAFNPAPD